MVSYILALDQGTTSSRAIVFDRQGDIVGRGQYPFTQHYPRAGWVEHDPMEIWRTQAQAATDAIAGLPVGSIAGIGVTNQRETTIIWDKATGEPVYNAIVWQCRRTAELCEELKRRGLEERIRSATGLLIDAYFSGSKIRWILDSVPGVRRRAERGEVLFGTVESWLIWKLTGRHVTDFANASRTMLFDIHRLCWDEELCGILGVPTAMLPAPVPNSTVYGTVQPGIPGLESLAGTPVCGAAGDQQSALFGQTCFAPGEAKNTYGTGCFTLMNVGGKPVRSRAGLLTSVAWQVDGQTTYALEGSVFNGGSTIQWLRDELGIISSAPEIDALAATVPDSGGVVVVPAFTGLGAPYWDMYARGAILGVTRGTGRAHIARAVLEAIAFQVTDLMLAMRQDAGCDITCGPTAAPASAISCCKCRRICCAFRWIAPPWWRPPPSARRRWQGSTAGCGAVSTSWRRCAAATGCSRPSGCRRSVTTPTACGSGRCSAAWIGSSIENTGKKAAASAPRILRSFFDKPQGRTICPPLCCIIPLIPAISAAECPRTPGLTR